LLIKFELDKVQNSNIDWNHWQLYALFIWQQIPHTFTSSFIIATTMRAPQNTEMPYLSFGILGAVS